MSIVNVVSEYVPEWYESTSAGRALVQKARAEEEAQRRDLAGRIRALEAKKTAAWARATPGVDKARTDLKTAEQKLIAARRAFERASGERREEVRRITFEQDQVARALWPLVATMISEARLRLDQRVDEMRRSGLRSELRRGEGHDNNGGPRYVTWSNRRALEHVVWPAIRDARDRFANVVRSAPEDFAAEIAAIEGSILWSALDELEPL